MRASKQNTIPLVAKCEATKLDRLADSRCDEELAFENGLVGGEVVVDEPSNRLSEAMGAGETIAVRQRVAIDAELGEKISSSKE